jgi:hypothetical protein
VQSNEQNYRFLLDMKGAIFLTKTYTIQDDKLPMPSDGNCLFHTLGAGLCLLEPEMTRRGMWNGFPFDHESIREKVNEWMIAHLKTDAKLKEHIDNAIMEYCPILEVQQRRDRLSVELDNRTIDDDLDYQEKEKQIAILRSVQFDSPGTLQAHKLYIEMTRGLGKFASSPQMYAFCQLNPNVGIVVAKTLCFPGRNGAPDRKEVSFDQFPPFNPDARFIIKPHFNESGDHFDLNISVDQRSLPDQPSFVRSVEK